MVLHSTGEMGQGEVERLGSLLARRPVTPRLIRREWLSYAQKALLPGETTLSTFGKSSPLKVYPHSPLEELPITNPPSELQQSPGRHGRLKLGGSFVHGHPARRGPSRRDHNPAVLALKSHSSQPRAFLSFIRLGERVSRGNLSWVHCWA